MKTQKTIKTIDMTDCLQCPGLIARKIWQELFVFYKDKGDLNHMDSFLCDLNYLQKWIENCQRIHYKTNTDPILYWECNGWWTNLDNCCSDENECIKIQYFYDEQKFTIESSINND